MEIYGQQRSRRELAERTGDVSALAGIRSVVLDDGVERGVRALQLRTAAGLELEVLVDRAFDFGSARLNGVPVGWRSGNGFRHPGLHEHSDEGGLSWLRSLDGLLVTGGLDHTLAGAEVDARQYGYPGKASVTQGLHGRLTAIPARVLEAREVVDPATGESVLRVSGEVVQATSFGEHLRLLRTIELDLAGREIRWHDVVENLGFERTPHMFLYHLNIGWPFVDEGARLVAPITRTLFASDSATDQGVSYRTLSAPQPGFVEQVFEHELVPGGDGRHRVALLAADDSRGVEVSWTAAAMPCFLEWQNLRSGQYTVGLEPSTHHVGGEAAARSDGSMIWLEHGDRREYSATLRVLDGADEVRAVHDEIRAIGDQPD